MITKTSQNVFNNTDLYPPNINQTSSFNTKFQNFKEWFTGCFTPSQRQVCAQCHQKLNPIKIDVPAILGTQKAYSIVPGEFIITNDDWDKLFSTPGSRLCRHVEFGSIIPNSTFTKMSFAGWTDGTLIFQLGFDNDQWQKAKSYLADQGIPFSIMLPHGLCTNNKQLVRKIMDVLKIDNRFSEKELTLIERIIAT